MIILCCVHSVHLIESDFPPLLKVWVFWEGQKIWKNLCCIFDKNVVFCVCNSALVKKSTTMFFFLNVDKSCYTNFITIISILFNNHDHFNPACLLWSIPPCLFIRFQKKFSPNCSFRPICLFRSSLVLESLE